MTGECELHDVEFDKCSVCPVCEAVYFERERIIKLLQSKIMCNWKQEHCEACDQTDYLVALIKGENK